MTYWISLERNTLRFAAAHFATFGGGCEPLHGHNYVLTVELEGELTPDSWVFDFTEAKRLVAGICKELDHKFLLAARSRELVVGEDRGEIEVRFGDRRYVIPAGDVASLPIDNTTAERLAEWFAGRIGDELRSRGAANVRSIRVGVEEAQGQAGWYNLALPAHPEQ